MNEGERMRDLVESYQRSIAAHDSDRARIWARLQAPAIASTQRSAPTLVRRSPAVMAIGIAIAVAAAVVLVLGLAGRLVDRTAIAPRSESVDLSRHEPTTGAARARAAVDPAVPPASHPAAGAPTPPPPAEPPTQVPMRTPAAVGDPLRVELALVESASAAIDRNDHALALQRLDEHARHWPTGALRPEARALRTIALCGSGRRAQGRGEAHVLLRDATLSAFHARVREACALQ
jgi:hypothetical protein